MTGAATAPVQDRTRRVMLSKQTISACDAALRRFQHDTRDLGAAGLVGPDGFEIASVRRDDAAGFSIGKVAALTSTMAAVGVALARETGQGVCRSLIVDADEGRTLILAVPAGKRQFSLFVTAGDSALLGQLIVNSRKCIDVLAQILEADTGEGQAS